MDYASMSTKNLMATKKNTLAALRVKTNPLSGKPVSENLIATRQAVLAAVVSELTKRGEYDFF